MQEKKRKQAETERKRAEVRARLEEASKAKKAKKGFMTPDRKKKLRVSPLFVSSLLVVRPSEFSQDILFKYIRSRQVTANFSLYFSFLLMETLMPRRIFKSTYILYHINTLPHRMFIIDNLLRRQSNSSFPIYFIASSHVILFSRVVRRTILR